MLGRLGAAALRVVLMALLLVASINALAWLVLQWGILPRIGDWRPEIEQHASTALGVPVRIGNIEASGRGTWSQSVELRDVRLLRADGGDALHLPQVHARLSPRSLLHWPPRFDRLEFEGPALEVRRDARGRLSVAGIALDAAGSDDGQFADWLFRQPSLRIRAGTLNWIDESGPSGGAEPLALSDLELSLSNGLRRHEFRLDATPPADFGSRFSLRGKFTQPLVAQGAAAAHDVADADVAADEAPGGIANLLPGFSPPSLVRPGDWRRWRGRLFAETAHIDIERLRERLPLHAALQGGSGALRGWFELRDGTLRGATVDLALQDIALQFTDATEPLAFERIAGRLGLALEGNRGELRLDRLGFDTADQLHWPASDLRLAWRSAGTSASLEQLASEPLAAGELQAQRLDLALLARLAERVPLSAPQRERIAQLAPQGLLKDLDLHWDGPAAAPIRYRVRGNASGLALAAAPLPGEDAPPEVHEALAHGHWFGRPGIAGADLGFEASERGGSARLQMRNGAVELPGVFEEPRIAIDRLSTQLSWTLEPGRTELRARALQVANADAEGEFEIGWQRSTPPPSTAASAPADLGSIDINGRFTRARLPAVARYLPLSIPAGVRHYLDHAIQAGESRDASVRVRGPLHDFPFDGGRGGPQAEFRISAPLADARFAYLPADPAWDGSSASGRPWPAIDGIRGTLLIDRNSLELRKLQARMSGVGSGRLELAGVQGRIADLAHDATLVIDGRVKGPLADMLGFVGATPVGGWLGGTLAHATAGGNAELKLGLQIPFADGAPVRTQGQLQLAGNDIRLGPELPPLAAAQGRIGFNEHGISSATANARLLGGDFAIDGGRQADGSERFNLHGTLTADGLRRATELGPLARLGAYLQGQTSYRGWLATGPAGTEWQLSSPLSGMASELPAPLRKNAPETLQLSLHSSPQAPADTAGAGAATRRDQLRLDLGAPGQPGAVQALALRESGGEGGPRLLRSAIGIGEPAPPAVAGGAANINLAALSVDAWRRVVDSLAGGTEAGNAVSLPASILLRTQELGIGGRKLNKLTAGLTRAGQGADAQWRATLDAQELAGTVEWSERGAGALRARLSRLALPRSEAEAVSSLLERAPASVPALDVVVEDFELRGKHLGKLEIAAANRAEAPGLPAEWQLSRLALTTPDAQLAASGRWAPPVTPGAARRTELDFKLDVADGGALLNRLGHGQLMRGGKGQLAGRLGWQGSPLAPDYPSLDGQMNLALEQGQFLQAKPGAARLLGVLSLQSLPRRLMLDFRDVFNEGFAFDGIGGDISIERGVASTRNLRTRGVQALVLAEGSADLERETQDLRVWVLPEINAGAASLAYAAINPVVGLGAFVATWFLRDPLIAANTREFHVTGPWGDPKVERVERSQLELPPNRGLPEPKAPGLAAASAPRGER
ncbi:YhdP family protein [Rivibacter subsaxonicus]|uniref:Uncharacterized protein (TIGR02099 family) n=1 Tax=Rivibacter subsaxonicus TaxID=457575 RepID=A0A4Q7VWE5_9BURK|nr:YhdP family protein [Rivibacter subsaxonicus]RZU00639.1 uncharacterized protein (TIGR02099 family) [Rivibacter subsaxonicus]